MQKFILFLIPFMMIGCQADTEIERPVSLKYKGPLVSHYVSKYAEYSTDKKLGVATFAGGCFWCMEGPFENIPGVLEAFSGYTGGEIEYPSYYEVSQGKTKHREAVQIFYDKEKVSYEKLLETFWKQIDPTDSGGQFADRGLQYRTAIFYHDKSQQIASATSKKVLANTGKFTEKIATEILPASQFYLAEDDHQDFYLHSGERYKKYKKGSGRVDFIEENWKIKSVKYKKPSDEFLKDQLTPLQYQVTQNEKTEKAFENTYWDNQKAGIYVDVVSGEPLFSSLEKYKSGTGWPTFWAPLEPSNIVKRKDYKILWPRTEIRSKYADSHVGHVFEDGPTEHGGLRYCMNSAALKFVPLARLEAEGYGDYIERFKK